MKLERRVARFEAPCRHREARAAHAGFEGSASSGTPWEHGEHGEHGFDRRHRPRAFEHGADIRRDVITRHGLPPFEAFVCSCSRIWASVPTRTGKPAITRPNVGRLMLSRSSVGCSPIDETRARSSSRRSSGGVTPVERGSFDFSAFNILKACSHKIRRAYPQDRLGLARIAFIFRENAQECLGDLLLTSNAQE